MCRVLSVKCGVWCVLCCRLCVVFRGLRVSGVVCGVCVVLCAVCCGWRVVCRVVCGVWCVECICQQPTTANGNKSRLHKHKLVCGECRDPSTENMSSHARKQPSWYQDKVLRDMDTYTIMFPPNLSSSRPVHSLLLLNSANAIPAVSAHPKCGKLTSQ